MVRCSISGASVLGLSNRETPSLQRVFVNGYQNVDGVFPTEKEEESKKWVPQIFTTSFSFDEFCFVANLISNILGSWSENP